MSNSTLQLGLNLPRLHAGELTFILEWAASRVEKFPCFTAWLATLAAGELARRQIEGMEAGSVPLPDLHGAEAADFLMASFSLAKQPLTESLAEFVDDVHTKIVCDVAGFLEWQAEQ